MKISKKQLSAFISEAIKQMGFAKSKTNLQMEKTDAIPGGLAQGKTLTDLARKLDPKGYYHNDQLLNALKRELEKGMKVEMEHTSDPKVAKEIALDHLFEDPRYYTKLLRANLEESQDKKKIKFTKPNFEYEWNEAKRYPEFRKIGKEGWIEIARKGNSVSYSSIEDHISNVDLDFEKLDNSKKQRFQKAFEAGSIETPIAVKFAEKDYDLVAGNTRLSGLLKNGIEPKIWIVDISELQDDVTERKLTKKEKTGLTKIHKDVSKKPFIKQYGKEEGEKIYYATTTKMAKKKY